MKIISGFYKPVELEQRILSFWADSQIFQKIQKSRKDQPLFRFLEGPPTVNGYMHVGHARGRTMKDVVLRYKTMGGFNVWRKAGWDCQGLPVELEAEKKLGVSSKKEIENKIGLQRFVEECNRLVDHYLSFWRNASERLALSLDYDAAYETRAREYIEFVWWAIKQADKKGLLIEDFKVVPKCPRCETSLSGHEVAQGYASKIDPSIYVKFPLQDSSNEFVIIWTTTPWTLPGDEAISVHPSHIYVKLKVGAEIWIMAKERVKPVLDELEIKDYELISEFYGKKLEGLKYHHPLNEEVPAHKEHNGKTDHTLVSGEHVNLDEGTGCVHTAPAHGPEDFEIGKKYGLKMFCPVDERGRLTQEGGKYFSLFVKDADKLIINDLDKKNLLLKSGTIEHEYPFCWRCNSPLIYLADKQWFLRVKPLKEKILKENKLTCWIPQWAGLSRFEDWLINADDWCISRSRIWGSPLNIWVCSDCEAKQVIGTVEEILGLAKNPPKHLNLHRPWIDQIVLKCPSCNGDMNRVEYVIDCWFDSGVAHTASLGLNNSALFNRIYPYDFITEAIDQTRGWFYSLVFTGVMLFDSSPYRQVLCQGHVLDKYGQKMSKSKGNVMWALELMDEVGADPLRLYELWKASPWDSLSFDYDEIEQVSRHLSILWNVFAFATTYMSLDDFTPEKWAVSKIKGRLRPEDQWLLSRTQSLIDSVTKNLEDLSLHKAVRVILKFIKEDLSHFYIRLVRKRTWTEKNDPDKLAAYATLSYCLMVLLKLLAPFAPYISEELYQTFKSNRSETLQSVHLCDWPKSEMEFLNKELEAEMDIIEDLLTHLFNARQRAKIKLRWPLKKVYIVVKDAKVLMALRKLNDLFLDQANTKELIFLADYELPAGVTLEVGLNFNIAGPILKSKIQKITPALDVVDGLKAKREIEKTGEYSLCVADKSIVKLSADLLSFKEVLPRNLVAIDTNNARIYLDVTRTSELIAESLAKDIIRRIQLMRKEMDLNVEEYIDVGVSVSRKKTINMLLTLKDTIALEVRAEKLDINERRTESSAADGAYVKDWSIEGKTVKIAVSRSKSN